MLRFLKSLSRTVHEEQHQDEDDNIIGSGGRDGDGGGGSAACLTVWRKSLFVGCSGFTVIDSDGNLVYRVDNYGSRRPQQTVLMDGSGRPILTVSRSKKLKLGESWVVYKGEVGDCGSTKSSKKEKSICCATKHANILQPNANVIARVYLQETSSNGSQGGYVVEGSYMNRSCKVLDESGKMVAEIRRKEAAMEGISFGLEVFELIVHPGFNPGFAMAVVLLLDQMFS